MSLPRTLWDSVAETFAGSDLAPARDALNAAQKPTALARLLRLHAEAGYLAENTPEIIAHPDAARGLEQALIESVFDCLGTSDVAEESAAQRRHEKIMRRFHAAIAEHPKEALYIPDLCAAMGVSQRTSTYAAKRV